MRFRSATKILSATLLFGLVLFSFTLYFKPAKEAGDSTWCQSILDQKLAQQLKTLDLKPKPQWVSTYEIVAGRDRDEIKNLNGYVVIGVVVSTFEAKPEPPLIEDFYFKPSEGKKPLYQLARINSNAPVLQLTLTPSRQDVIGGFRREYFLLAPKALIESPGAFVGTLKSDQTIIEFFSNQSGKAFESSSPDPNSPPDPDTVARILNEEFCFARPRMLPQM